MEDKVFAYITKYNLIKKGDNVIVALSGGADSMALFHFLHKQASSLQITLQAAHFDHGLRGEESARDAEFVKKVCRQYKVQLYMQQGFMKERTRPVGMGEEEWARHLRLGYLENLAKQQQAIIATAHTLSDNAETVLFRAVRGSGPRGIAGIPPKRGVFIRPLLHVSRAEVEAYCTGNGLEYVTDSTNASVCYARNRIRLSVLPELERVHPGAEQALARLGETMRGVEEYIAQEADVLLHKSKRKQGYDVGMLLAAPEPVRMAAFSQLSGKNADSLTLNNMQRVASGQLGALQLSENHRVRLVQKKLIIERLPKDNEENYNVPLREGEIELPDGTRLLVRVEKANKKLDVEEKNVQRGLTFEADYDKIKRTCVFRGRLPGDVYRPAGRGVAKTLKKWMNEEEIPLVQRKTLPLLAQGSEVLWIAGYGFCDGLAITESTVKRLYIEIL